LRMLDNIRHRVVHMAANVIGCVVGTGFPEESPLSPKERGECG
jgi:hypothetical protein